MWIACLVIGAIVFGFVGLVSFILWCIHKNVEEDLDHIANRKGE